MKNYISINQGNFVKIAELKKIKVDATDGILFDWIQNFTKSEKALKKLIDNKLFIWVSYKAIREDNPLCNINTNDVIGRRLNKLVDLGLLVKYFSKEDGSKTFFSITEYAFKYLLESNTLPTQKSEGYDSKVGGGTTSKSDNSKLDSKLDSNIKNKQKESLVISIKDIISYYSENISSLQAKIKETKAIHQIAMIPRAEKESALLKIKTGLEHYSKVLPEEKYITNLEKFIGEKIYLDFQVPKQSNSKQQNNTGPTVSSTIARAREMRDRLRNPNENNDDEILEVEVS